MNISRQPIDKLNLPPMNQVASSHSENRRRRERQIHMLLRRLEAENEAINSIESSNIPLPDAESEEEMELDLPDSYYEEQYNMLVLQCPTLVCRGYIVDSSYAGMKNFTCTGPGCSFRISGYSTTCTTKDICDSLGEVYGRHSKWNCKEIPGVNVDIADGCELLFVICKCGFVEFLS